MGWHILYKDDTDGRMKMERGKGLICIEMEACYCVYVCVVFDLVC